MNENRHHQHAQSGPPPPASMSSPNNPPGPPPYAYDAARRHSLNGDSSSHAYRGKHPHLRSKTTASFKSTPANSPAAPAHDPPPPPPSSFARPQMPPPSSPPQQQLQAPQTQRSPYASTFSPNRELPGLGQALRQGGSMSISSLIGGGDTGAPTQASQSQPSPPTNAPLSNSHSMQPPSPRRSMPSTSRAEFPPFRRVASPDRNMYGNNASRPPEGQPFSARSPSRSYSSHASPDRQSLPATNPSYKTGAFPGQRLFAPSDAARQTSGSIPPRPNSQPIGSLEQEGRSLYDTPGGRRGLYGAHEERRRTLGESARPNVAEILGGVGQNALARDRPVTVQPVSKSVFSPPLERHSIAGPTEHPRSTWRSSAPTEGPREPVDHRREEPAPMPRSYGPYLPSALGGPRSGGPGPEDILRGRNLDLLSNRVVEQYHAPPTSDPNSVDRHRTEPLSRSLSSGNRFLYDQPQRMGEAMQHSKSHIGFGLEAYRRTGRASPLPQAVQGAQAQPLSIGKDPGIKSEFGRMFSGLGSGLGSSTPSRGSPMPQNGGSFSHESESLQRVSSQQGRKPKRVKDEEGIFDVDGLDGRGTPGIRGSKRSKHHHHHTPHHQ